MAPVTSVGGVGVVALVANITVAGYCGVGTIQGVKSIVVKRSRRPGCFAVATGTIRGELSGCVIRVGRGRVVTVVAAVTGVGRIGIIPVVAGIAIIGNGCVRAIQRIKSVVVK